MPTINVYDVEGKIKKEIELPDIFRAPIREDIIRKTVRIFQANARQPYGASPFAGKRHVTHPVGKGFGMSRVQRLRDRTGSFSPGTVGGRKAHPPKSEKKWKLKINKKEKKKAFFSALSATCNPALVEKRGHKFKKDITLPVVIEDEFEGIKKTKDVISLFKKIGIYDDVERAEKGKHIRAGKGKRRGRKYRIPKSMLIVVTDGEILRSARNLTGVDVVKPNMINVEQLAPGGTIGRLTVFSEKAFNEVISHATSA